jgi:hypothetical protein
VYHSTVYALAYDKAGNTKQSDPITVVVDLTPAPNPGTTGQSPLAQAGVALLVILIMGLPISLGLVSLKERRK